MNDKLARALMDLCAPDKKRLFLANPESFLQGYDLSEADKAALRSKDRTAVRFQLQANVSEPQSSFGILRETINTVDLAPNHDTDIDHHDGDASENRTAATFERILLYQSAAVPSDNSVKALWESDGEHTNELWLIGTGISYAHITIEGLRAISKADLVLYCVADPVTEVAIRNASSASEDLYRFYENGKQRNQTYNEMSERITEVLRGGSTVCAAFYGHPGIFVKPAHLAMEAARSEHYGVRLYPSVSSIDCLIADLAIDPSWDGCQVVDATRFMMRRIAPDKRAGIILLQIGCIGDPGYCSRGLDKRHWPLLVKRLVEYYGPDHKAVLYEASEFPVCIPRIDLMSITDLASAAISGTTTLYIPPLENAPIDRDMAEYFRQNAPVYT